MRDILQCIHDMTKDCTDEDNMGSIESTIRGLKSLVGDDWCDLTLPPDPPVCEPEPSCTPDKAVETCFAGIDEFTDICR